MSSTSTKNVLEYSTKSKQSTEGANPTTNIEKCQYVKSYLIQQMLIIRSLVSRHCNVFDKDWDNELYHTKYFPFCYVYFKIYFASYNLFLSNNLQSFSTVYYTPGHLNLI